MTAGANRSVTAMRRAAGHPTVPLLHHLPLGIRQHRRPRLGVGNVEHRRLGDVNLHVANISAHGFMVDNAEGLQRGDRVIIRLPKVGRLEAYVIWTRDQRAGFQFERIIRFDDFMSVIDTLQPNPRLRRPR